MLRALNGEALYRQGSFCWVAVGLLLIWQASSSLLVIFAGVLFASFLDACARALEPIIPVGRVWRLTLVVLVLAVLILLGLL